MNSSITDNAIAGMPTKLNNYDVLLLPSANEEPLKFAPCNHPGNQRFRVLLTLFRQKYLQAYMLGDEQKCASIAQEVVNTVHNKCVPNGRFFQQGRDNRWYQFRRDSQTIVKMIRNTLKNDPTESCTMERSPKRVCRRSEGFELLYQAASKGLPTQDKIVKLPNPFDVVCQANGRGISHDRKHTGNNRLKIILHLRKKSYETSDEEDKQRIAKEIVSSIVDDASSNFLQVDKPSRKYKVVSRDLAAKCVKGALDADTEGDKQQLRNSEVQKLVQRKHKKAILDRLENREGGSCLSFDSPMPTTFHSLLTRNVLVPKAA